MLNALAVFFYFRKNRSDKLKKGTIYCRISVNSQRAPGFSTKIKIEPQFWDQPGQKVRDGHPSAIILNKKLFALANRIHAIELDLFNKDKPVTAGIIHDILLGKKVVNHTFRQAGNLYMKEIRQGIPEDYTYDTFRHINIYYNNVLEFTQEMGSPNILLSEINANFMRRLRAWMLKRSSNNYTIRHLNLVKNICKYGIANEMIEYSPVLHMQFKKSPDKPIVYLNEDEIEKMKTKEITINRIAEIRDLFLFQCYTGLSYTELYIFCMNPLDYIQIGLDKKRWIYISRGKVRRYKTQYSIPILKEAEDILRQYDYKIPVKSNQKYNGYLKEVADICGINKNLTTHVARKTFGMLLLNADVPIETVSLLLGHTNIRTTQRYYAKVLEKKISRDINKFQEGDSGEMG